MKHEMATTKTTTIAVRVSNDLAEKLATDATDLGMSPGAFLRRLLETRYSSRPVARRSDDEPRIIDMKGIFDD